MMLSSYFKETLLLFHTESTDGELTWVYPTDLPVRVFRVAHFQRVLGLRPRSTAPAFIQANRRRGCEGRFPSVNRCVWWVSAVSAE